MIIERRTLQGIQIGPYVVQIGRITKGKVKVIVKGAASSTVVRLDEVGQVEIAAYQVQAFIQKGNSDDRVSHGQGRADRQVSVDVHDGSNHGQDEPSHERSATNHG